MVQFYQWSLWKVPEAFNRNAINSAGLYQFQINYQFLQLTWSYHLRAADVYVFEQSLNSSLHPPFMVFITQFM
jgi:hypothetical protein